VAITAAASDAKAQCAVERYRVAEVRGEAVAIAFERSRGAVVSLTAGNGAVLVTALERLGRAHLRTEHVPFSADLLSESDGALRVIEVKARGGKGPIEVPERELETFRAAGEFGWLYVVWNTTQPPPYELWVVRDPIRLPWVECQSATRTRGIARGVRHEARYRIDVGDVEAAGERIDLGTVSELPVKGP